MSQKDKKGTSKKSTNNFRTRKSNGTQKGIRTKPVPKRSEDK